MSSRLTKSGRSESSKTKQSSKTSSRQATKPPDDPMARKVIPPYMRVALDDDAKAERAYDDQRRIPRELSDSMSERGDFLIRNEGRWNDNVDTCKPLTSRSSQYRDMTPSILATDHDREMAGRQTQIDHMDEAEHEQQEIWALSLLGRCIDAMPWMRVKGGYRCFSGQHLITHELIEEGKAGLYCGRVGVEEYYGKIDPRRDPTWEGPLYGPEIIDYTKPPDMVEVRGRVKRINKLMRPLPRRFNSM